MALDLQELLVGAQGASVNRQGDASGNFMALTDRVFLQKYAEVDPVQAAAIKEIARGQAPDPTQAGPPR